MRNPFRKCPFCECDLLLESKIFWNAKDSLPKTRYLQAYVKYLKIKKLAETKEYKDRLGNSGRIRDLIKDCLNDMEMVIETKFGKRYERNKRNPSWEQWMHELANIRNYAIHKMTAFKIVVGGDTEGCYLRALRPNGEGVETNEQVLPYLEKTLEKIKAKLGITENIEEIRVFQSQHRKGTL